MTGNVREYERALTGVQQEVTAYQSVLAQTQVEYQLLFHLFFEGNLNVLIVCLCQSAFRRASIARWRTSTTRRSK